jgi:hypothetical protein
MAVVAAVLGLGSRASAELVVNGDFGTGDFTGWTQAGDTSFTYVQSGYVPLGYTFAAQFGPPTTGSISQLLTTVPGATYTLSFQLSNDVDGPPNSWSALWNGAQVAGGTDVPAFAYTRDQIKVVANSSSTPLEFDFSNGPGFFYLTGVSVATAEPSTLAIGGASGLLLVGFGLARRRRRC